MTDLLEDWTLHRQKPLQIKKNVYTWVWDQVMFVPKKYHQTWVDYFLIYAKPKDTFIVSITWEFRNPDNWIDMVHECAKYAKIILVLDNVYQRLDYDFGDLDVVFIDYFFVRTYFECLIGKSTTTAKTWNPDTGRFLFLSGKMYKLQRAGLIQRLLRAKHLDKCDYSCFFREDEWEETKPFVDNPTFENLVEEFGIQFVAPDSETVRLNSLDLLDSYNAGFGHDPTMYLNTSFRVVSESSVDFPVPWITEKTYLTIFNSHPFILACDKGALEVLKSHGYKTFENYLPYNYDEIENSAERMDAITDLIDPFFDAIQKHKSQIQKDIDHNHNNVKIMIELELAKLQSILDRVGAPAFNIWRVVRLWDHPWPDFYYNIKDESWPDCYRQQDFDKLPEHIQKECIDVFGWQPHVPRRLFIDVLKPWY